MSSLTVVSGQERNSYQYPGSVFSSRQLYSRNTVNISPDSPSPARCSIPHHAAELSSTLANIQLEWRKIWRWNRCVSEVLIFSISFLQASKNTAEKTQTIIISHSKTSDLWLIVCSTFYSTKCSEHVAASIKLTRVGLDFVTIQRKVAEKL